jgi:putative flavoprotein involved in K+ transport
VTRKTDALIIGAGQAGLAMSRCLSNYGIEHIVLDRGAVAQRWRAERWTSLRLLTPNWMTRLPGSGYDGADPEGFMHKDEVVGFLNRYARSFDAPVREYVSVSEVVRTDDGYRVETSEGRFLARSVVLATGACDRPAVPGFAKNLSPCVTQVTTSSYMHADALEEGGVLVVGASATGVQLAEEIHLSGRPVTLAVGSHVRLPRQYRGRDIMQWLDASGLLNESRDPDIAPERILRQPSLQLVGSVPARNIGLASLARLGVRLTARVEDGQGTKLRLRDNLAPEIRRAEARGDRLLDRIDSYIERNALEAGAPERPPEIDAGDCSGTQLDLSDLGIRTVVWATGFRRDYRWLRVPVLNSAGEIRQNGGITPEAGLYTLGLPFMRRRNSTFIDGVGADARDLSFHLADFLGQTRDLAA